MITSSYMCDHSKESMASTSTDDLSISHNGLTRVQIPFQLFITYIQQHISCTKRTSIKLKNQPSELY